MIKRVFLDLDGVLANFMDKAFLTFNIKFTEDNLKAREVWEACGFRTEREFWQQIELYGENWWEAIEPFEHTARLYHLCKNLAPTCILSKTGPNPSAAAGKMKWMYKNLGPNIKDFLLGRNKNFCADSHSLLIDDYDKNCEEFMKHGGKAFLWPQPYNNNCNMSVDEAIDTIRLLIL